jgi:hypothetical protein
MEPSRPLEPTPPIERETCGVMPAGTVVTTPCDIAQELGFEWDGRFRHWARIIMGFDANVEGGYALAGTWVRWTEHMALADGVWVVLGAETGSRKTQSYHFALVHREAGRNVQVKVSKALDQYLTEGAVTPEERAKAANSLLYAYGLYFDVVTRRRSHP